MYAKFKSGATSVYDVVIPSDYMIDKMIEEDMLEEINYDNIPNYKNIDEEFKYPDYDNTGEGELQNTPDLIHGERWVSFIIQNMLPQKKLQHGMFYGIRSSKVRYLCSQIQRMHLRSV